MLRKVLVGLAAAALAAPVSAQTVDEVIAKACEARGGVAKIKAVQSVRMTGHMTMGPGAEAPITLEMKRPRSTRMEFTAQGQTGVQAYDGKQAWGIAPMGSRKPEPLPDEMARNIDAQADLDGPLVDYKAKGHQVELVGKETVDGVQAWKLKLTPKGGDVVYVFLDASSFLEIRNETHRLVRGPHRIQAGPKGRPEKQVLSFDKIEVNVPIDDARFKMPSR
jgi:outer membrane lipoprotein-sorting protein